MEDPASARLFDYFMHVSDPRSANARHRLFDIFVIALCAVISGAEGWEDMQEYGQARAVVDYAHRPGCEAGFRDARWWLGFAQARLQAMTAWSWCLPWWA
jgi:hypothetical protein